MAWEKLLLEKVYCTINFNFELERIIDQLRHLKLRTAYF